MLNRKLKDTQAKKTVHLTFSDIFDTINNSLIVSFNYGFYDSKPALEIIIRKQCRIPLDDEPKDAFYHIRYYVNDETPHVREQSPEFDDREIETLNKCFSYKEVFPLILEEIINFTFSLNDNHDQYTESVISSFKTNCHYFELYHDEEVVLTYTDNNTIFVISEK